MTQTPSPTDIQQREAIARIVDPQAHWTLDGAVQRVRDCDGMFGSEPKAEDEIQARALEAFEFWDHTRADALAKADAILKLVKHGK